jgi:hypothetical protein
MLKEVLTAAVFVVLMGIVAPPRVRVAEQVDALKAKAKTDPPSLRQAP